MIKKYLKSIIDGQQLETVNSVTYYENKWKFYKIIVYKRPKIAGILIPALIINFFWWSYVISTNKFYLFN